MFNNANDRWDTVSNILCPDLRDTFILLSPTSYIKHFSTDELNLISIRRGWIFWPQFAQFEGSRNLQNKREFLHTAIVVRLNHHILNCHIFWKIVLIDTSLCAQGTLTHRQQHGTACKIQNCHQGNQKWPTGSTLLLNGCFLIQALLLWKKETMEKKMGKARGKDNVRNIGN